MSFGYAPSGGGTQPVATGSSVASAPVNLAFAQIGGAFNNHVLGTQYPHALIAGGGGVNVSQTLNGVTAASASVTDLWTMLDRLANAIGVLNLGSSAAGAWANLSGVPANQGVGTATAAATASALVRRGTSGEASFAQLVSAAHFATSPATGTPAGNFRGATGDPTQAILAAQNNAGTVNKWYADNAGNTVQVGNVNAVSFVASGFLYAGSAITQVTDSTGLVRTAALPVVDAAHGGLGLDLTVSGNKPAARAAIGAAVSGANGDITSLTGLTTPIGAGLGGTGLSNPAAGSIPVTNGTGNWLLLPPTPANYFVVSNGTTYVAQAFTTSMIPPGSLNQSIMSALYPSPGTGAGNLLKVQAQPWQGYIGGAWVQFVGGTANYSPAIDPSGIGVGQTRIDLLVLNAAGNLAWITGTPSATPSIAATATPAQLSVVAPIWYVQVAQGATSITGYTFTGTNAAFIQDARNLFGPTAGSSGGGGYLAGHYATMTTETATLPNSTNIGGKAFVMVGVDADMTGKIGLPSVLEGGYIGVPTIVGTVDLSAVYVDDRMVRAGMTEAPLSDAKTLNLQGDLLSRIGRSGNAAVVVSAGSTAGVIGPSSPLTLAVGGRRRTNTAPLTATASGATGARYLVADLSGTGPTFTISLQSAPLVLGLYQIELGQYWWNASTGTLYSSPPFAGVNAFAQDLSPLFKIESTQVASNFWPWQAGGVDVVPAATSSFTAMGNMPTLTFTLAGTFHVKVTTKIRGQMTIGSAGDNAECQVSFDRATSNISVADIVIRPPTSVVSGVWDYNMTDIGYTALGPGDHTIGMLWTWSGATAMTLLTRYVLVEFYG